MDASSLQLSQLQHTVGLAMLKSAQSTGAAQAISLLEDFQKNQSQIQQAPHPMLGKHLDIRI